MALPDNAADQPEQHKPSDYEEQNNKPKYLKDYLYCHKIDEKYLLKGFLPRCRIMEHLFNDSKCSISIANICYPPDFTQIAIDKANEPELIDCVISYLAYWINEKVEPERPVFWFYAYHNNPCITRFVAIKNIVIDRLITKFNFNHPAIANEIKVLTDDLKDEAKEWDDYNKLAKQTEQWIDPHHSRYSLFEVKEAAANLVYKLQHIGSMVREEQEPQEKVGQSNGGHADSKSDQNINIQNFHGIFGNVQAENVQTGDKANINKHNGIEKNNKGHIGRVFGIIAAIVTFSAALLTCLYYLGLFIYKLFTHK